MKTDLQDIARMIDAELTSGGWADQALWAPRPDMTPVTVRPAAKRQNGLLLQPPGWPAPLLFTVDQDTFTWTSAAQAANMLRVHEGMLDAFREIMAHAERAYGAMERETGKKALHWLNPASDTFNPQTLRISTTLNIIDHALVERITTGRGTEKDGLDMVAGNAAVREGLLRRRIETAGGARQALRICRVAAAAIRETPTGWNNRFRLALNGDKDAMASMAMKNGDVRPLLMFDSECAWKRNCLITERDLPETIRAALPGRPLTDLVSHRWLPTNLVISEVRRRKNGEIHVAVEEDGLMEPLAPLLEELGV